MKNTLVVVGFVLSGLQLGIAQEAAPKHEVGLTLGGLLSSDRSGNLARLNLGSGAALQANYGYRLFETRNLALYGEVHFLANAQRKVSSPDQALTRDVATIFVTPGIRLKFFPNRAVAPYAAIGGGWAEYEQSTTTLAGGSNAAPRELSHGAFDFGGGVDFKFWRFVGLRAEVRDFYAGGPAYNSASIRGGQHNVVAGGGLVLKFR